MTRSPSIISASLFILLLINLSACEIDNKAVEKNNNHGTHDHSQHADSQHTHRNLEVSSFNKNAAIPHVSFTVTPDSMGGWNVHINTEHFRFSPENVNTDANLGEGHAHLYLNNHKMARLYSNWYHLKRLTPGTYELRITLNANDHSNWSHQGQVITATQTIVQD